MADSLAGDLAKEPDPRILLARRFDDLALHRSIGRVRSAEVMATKKARGLWAFVFLVGIVLVVWLILLARWTDPMWYSARYWVHTGQVHWTAKAADCSGCRKVVTAYNADGQPVGGDQVPRCKHDLHIGRNVITYDGRTWTPLPLGGSCPDLKVASVEIRWTKAN